MKDSLADSEVFSELGEWRTGRSERRSGAAVLELDWLPGDPAAIAPLDTGCPVNSHNEWDPLEEVIVGIVDGATFPPWHISARAVVSEEQAAVLRTQAGTPFPRTILEAAREELDQLASILTAEGVHVRRPEPQDHSRRYGAPDWASTGMYDVMPRDVLLVFGHEIIECPMAWRSRYYAASSYRPLLKEYFRAGAKWSAAPKPELPDEFYDREWTDVPGDQGFRSVITEFEPTFDAADFVRCGRDIFVQRSHVTNRFGIEWLTRHLGDQYRVHVVELDDPHPMHIDASLMPLAPGKLLVNPLRVPKVPDIFAGWDVLRAPTPVISDSHPLYLTSKWLNMNVLMIDEQRVLVEREDEPMISALRDWGMTPIPCSFRHVNSLGGSFHCATLDIRRCGTLQSYF
jgi:glycine amidinotransferase